jgi:hypothetical protein
MFFYLNDKIEFLKLMYGQAQSYVVASKIHTVRAWPAIHTQGVSGSNPLLPTIL